MREETNKHNQKEGRKERKCEQKYRTQGACEWLILFAFCLIRITPRISTAHKYIPKHNITILLQGANPVNSPCHHLAPPYAGVLPPPTSACFAEATKYQTALLPSFLA